MTTVEQAYIEYKNKVEKNIKNDSITTSRERFVIIFNESQNKYQERLLERKGSDDIRYIEHLLVPDKSISESTSQNERQDFKLPENYFDLSYLKAFASKGKCKNQQIGLFEAISDDLEEFLIDENNKPSFKWREAPYILSSGNISVFNAGDFKVDEVLLTYYRYPNQISLINPNNPESKFDESKTIDWDKKSLDRIISIAAGEFDMNNNNPRFQVQNLRTQK